jgi:hypothetical protein
MSVLFEIALKSEYADKGRGHKKRIGPIGLI